MAYISDANRFVVQCKTCGNKQYPSVVTEDHYHSITYITISGHKCEIPPEDVSKKKIEELTKERDAYRNMWYIMQRGNQILNGNGNIDSIPKLKGVN